uniref:Chitin-binding type-2 domain-containing protein n=1 Tax=Strigamia maritima TaxID=126957 RepID=T1JNT6_STRMM
VNGRDKYCADEVGYFSNPLNCNEYFYCENWKATVKNCPHGFHFNPHHAVCDDPLTADCPKVCKQPDGHFPNPDDCTQGGMLKVKEMQGGMIK